MSRYHEKLRERSRGEEALTWELLDYDYVWGKELYVQGAESEDELE